MNLFGTSTDKCLTELKRLQTVRAKLEAEGTADRATLDQLRASLADAELTALLDGGDNSAMRREMLDIQAKMEGRQAARPKLLDKIRAAMAALGKARADVIREQAQKAKAVYDQFMAEQSRLLSALQEHSGVKWEMRLRPDVPPGAVYMPGELRPIRPKYMALAAEAQALFAQASGIENAALNNCRGGRVTGSTLAELEAVCDNVELLAPSAATVEAWFAEATRRAETAWARLLLNYPSGDFPGREVSYSLAWNAEGEIDAAESNATNREVRPAFRVALVTTRDETTGRTDSRVVATSA